MLKILKYAEDKGKELGIIIGIEQGKIEGIEKGIEKGETKALVKTVMKLLTKKFGVLPADYREKIGQLDVITLEMIIDEIWDCDNLVTIEKYFI